jgi:hypothetical protein
MVKLSKTEKLVNVLAKGKPLTADQITDRFGLQNPSATIHRLREDGGLKIYTNPRRDSDGYRFYQYRMSTRV